MVFDAMLEREAEALGVVVMRGWKATDLEMNQSGPSRLLARVANGPPHVFAAAYVVDARGRSPSRLGPSHSWVKIDCLVGITRYYDQVHAEQSEPRLWIEANSRGWWYSAPLPNNRFIATYMTDSDCCGRPIARCFHSNLEATSMTKRRIGVAHEVTRIIVTPAHSGRSRHFVSSNVIAIGDAAYSTDPARGHGLLNAMRHALAAATAIVRSAAGCGQSFAEYDAHLTKEWEKYLIGRSWHYRSEARWQSQPFWARRIEDTQSV
jgi:flavin-dependent dehydrogenase